MSTAGNPQPAKPNGTGDGIGMSATAHTLSQVIQGAILTAIMAGIGYLNHQPAAGPFADPSVNAAVQQMVTQAVKAALPNAPVVVQPPVTSAPLVLTDAERKLIEDARAKGGK